MVRQNKQLSMSQDEFGQNLNKKRTFVYFETTF